MKKQNEIINKISTQMQSNQKKRFKQFDGHFKNTIKLTGFNQLAPELIDGIKHDFRSGESETKFKANEYL